MTLRIALYARVSTKDQDDYGTSLDSQRRAMIDHADRNGYTVVADMREDYTGTTHDRPVINRIKAMAKNGEIDGILCYSRDRYARSRMAGMMLDVSFAGIKRLYVTREESLPTPQGRVRDGFDDLMHEYEVDMIKERTTRGKRERAQEGRIIGAGISVIYGYKRVKYNGRNTDLAIDDTVVSDIEYLLTPYHVVRYVFYLYVHEGATPMQIADTLNTYRIPAPRERIWRDKMIYTMLRREEYLGMFYAFKYQRTLNEKTGKYQPKERPRDEWIPIRREDLCILNRDTFQLAQDKLDNGRGRVEVKHDYLMNRRVKCMHGHSMTATARETPGSKYFRQYYMCRTNRFMLKKCDIPYFRSTAVDSAVWQWVISLVQDPEKVLEGYKLAQEEILTVNQEAIDTIGSCDRLIAQAEEELAYLVEEAKQFRTNPRVREQYRQQIEHQAQRIDLLQKERAQQEASISKDIISDKEIQQRVKMVTSLSVDVVKLDSLELSERKNLVELLGIYVVLGVDTQGKYCDIVWYGDTERVYLNSETSSRLELQTHKPIVFRIPLTDV